MKIVTCIDLSIHKLLFPARHLSAVLILGLCLSSLVLPAQAVTEIITDYNGFWKSASTAQNSIKPDKAHNLLAFTYNSIRYSTGVNDDLLATRGQTFTPSDFWSLPVAGMTGTISGNTKVGLGALYDGVQSGASNPSPQWGIAMYLTDGIKGLGLGTCIANLPVGSMSFVLDNIQPEAIGDGIPDILVTQVADPTGSSYDRYEFTDANGVRVGSYKDIVFTNISPVGTWTADFYEAATNPLTLQAGFTQTDRPLRLWAADLSELGVTVQNYQHIRNFRINLCGNSDVAFVAYNNRSLGFNNVLPVQYTFFKATLAENTVVLDWQTAAEQGADRFVVERSQDGVRFRAIDSVSASNQVNGVRNYQYRDASPLAGANYYRLRQVDTKGNSHLSKVLLTEYRPAAALPLQAYPNPATDKLSIDHRTGTGREVLTVYNLSGTIMLQQAIKKGSKRTQLDVQRLPAGSYVLCLSDEKNKQVTRFVVN